VPVHADGELVGTTPAEITVIPQALRVLVPRTANQALFRRALERSPSKEGEER
jgi:hypothetical protein